jgi:hypothetical protein
MIRTTIPIAALLLSALTASCSGVRFRVVGVDVPSMTTQPAREDPAYRERSGFPPRCHRGPEEPTGPSWAPETCAD